MKGLLLRSFNKQKLTAHPKVLKYYSVMDPQFDQSSSDGNEELKAFIKEAKKEGLGVVSSKGSTASSNKSEHSSWHPCFSKGRCQVISLFSNNNGMWQSDFGFPLYLLSASF